jgi:cyanate permease
VTEVVGAYSLFTGNCILYKSVNILNSFVPDVLKFDLKDAGLLAALPYLVMGITVQFGGFLADWLRSQGNLTTTQVLGLTHIYVCAVR